MVEAFARVEFDAQRLFAEYPPRFNHPHKDLLFRAVAPPEGGRLSVSRWRGSLPDSIDLPPRPDYIVHEDVFSYPPERPGERDWHLNFADSNLFGYYGGALLAQDEHQVLEHPILGSLREALLKHSLERPELAPYTREGSPTPITIRGALRSIAFNTQAGLYGNAFARAQANDVLAAATYLTPPTVSNILAMVAPAYGVGRYNAGEIHDVLVTAFIGFTACKLESEGLATVIHTGNWGCGAFGGDPRLMALLQMCAAWFAGVDRLVYHTVSPPFTRCYEQATDLLERLITYTPVHTRTLIDQVIDLRFAWGVSDGN